MPWMLDGFTQKKDNWLSCSEWKDSGLLQYLWAIIFKPIYSEKGESSGNMLEVVKNSKLLSIFPWLSDVVWPSTAVHSNSSLMWTIHSTCSLHPQSAVRSSMLRTLSSALRRGGSSHWEEWNYSIPAWLMDIQRKDSQCWMEAGSEEEFCVIIKHSSASRLSNLF